MWGDVPWTDALQGTAIMGPKYDSQQSIYVAINALLDDAIVNLGKTTVKFATFDYIYAGDQAKWIKAAYSLKARFALRLVNVDNTAATKALTAIPLGFASAADALIFNKFAASATGENPWYQFKVDRSHLSVSATLYNYMNERSDPRIPVYFTKVGGVYAPAPSGTAQQTQGGIYSVAAITSTTAGKTAPIPLISYH